MKKIEVMLTDGSSLETLELDVDNGTVDKFGNLIYSFPDGNTFGGHVLLKGFSEVSARSETNVQCDPDPWLLNMPGQEHRKVLPEDLDYGDKYLESSPLTDEKVWLSIFSNMVNCGNIVVTVADLRMRAEMADEGLKLFKERFRK